MIRGVLQRGFTLVEVMVGLAVGLLILLVVTTVYLNTLHLSGALLKSSRLNQEMGAILNIMANDIRRAGYWGTAIANFNTPQNNPFTKVDSVTPANTTALRVYATDDNGSSYGDKTEAAALVNRVGSCIVYTYDVDHDGAVDDDEKFGFRWHRTAGAELDMRMSTSGSANNCLGTGWNAVTEVGTIEITDLTFSLAGSTCINSSEPDSEEDGGDAGIIDDFPEYNCYTVAPDVGNRTLENIAVTITLKARLVDAPEVTATMSQSVQVRNYIIRQY
jgi:prepilin peptidase dependent protein B